MPKKKAKAQLLVEGKNDQHVIWANTGEGTRRVAQTVIPRSSGQGLCIFAQEGIEKLRKTYRKTSKVY